MYSVNKECPHYQEDCSTIGCENCYLHQTHQDVITSQDSSIETFQRFNGLKLFIKDCTSTPEEKKKFIKSLVIFLVVGVLLFSSPFIILYACGYRPA